MSRKKLKARSRITQRMTNNGLVERNESTGGDIRISKRGEKIDVQGTAFEGGELNAGITGARGENLSHSNNTARTDNKQRKRNKNALYRNHTQNTGEAPVQQANSIVQGPNHAGANTETNPQTHGRQTSKSKLRTRRETSYTHKRKSVLQTATVTALQEGVSSDPAFKHQGEDILDNGDSKPVTDKPGQSKQNATGKKRRGADNKPVTNETANATPNYPTHESVDTSDSKPQTETRRSPEVAIDIPAPEPVTSRKLITPEEVVIPTNTKLKNAKKKLPTKKKPRSRLIFGEVKGKTKAGQLKSPLPLRPITAGANVAVNLAHSEIFHADDENVEIKAANRGKRVAEHGVRSMLRHHKTRKSRRAEKLRKSAIKKNVNLSHSKAVEKNTVKKSNIFSRMWQKRKIRKQYAKAAHDTKMAASGVQKTGSLIARATRFVGRVIFKNPKIVAILILVGLAISMIMSIIGLGLGMASGGMGGILNSVYLAEDEAIENAALTYSEWEVELQVMISNIHDSFPGFDEYQVSMGSIGHNPLELMAYLTAAHHNFTYPEIRAVLQELFDAQYQIEFSSAIEIRFDEYGQPYFWNIHTTTLTTRTLTSVIEERLTDAQQQHFDILMTTNGGRQIVGSPFDFDWLPFVSSHYGWRIHPITGNPQIHRGIDIGLPTGTPILAAHDGVVTFAGWMGGYGYVVFIAGENGIETRYAHCDTIIVTVGQEVSAGDPIATVGSTGDSTGPHLHFEILVDGIYRNPIFFAFTGVDG